jgi:hypothetical protein
MDTYYQVKNDKTGRVGENGSFVWFGISREWINQWSKYVQDIDNASRPGPIYNKPMVEKI